MPIQIGEKSYYTVEDINNKTGLHPKTIRELLKTGRLRGKKTRPEMVCLRDKPPGLF